jgi:hypothetical protein
MGTMIPKVRALPSSLQRNTNSKALLKCIRVHGRSIFTPYLSSNPPGLGEPIKERSKYCDREGIFLRENK